MAVGGESYTSAMGCLHIADNDGIVNLLLLFFVSYTI